MIGARVGSDGVSAGLPNAGSEIVAIRVWRAVPVHDELITTSWVSVDDLISKYGEKEALTPPFWTASS